jgi:Two component regulator propeller
MRLQQHWIVDLFGTFSRSRWLVAHAMVLAVLAQVASAQTAAPPPLRPIEPVADTPFWQEYREPFISWRHGVGEAPISVAVDSSGRLWSAGPWGVRQLVEGKWQPPAGEPLNGPAFGLAAEGEIVWVATWDGLFRLENGKLARAAFNGQPLGIVKLTDGRLIVGGPKGLSERHGDEWKAISGYYSRSLTDVAAVKDTLWIATQRGLFELRDGKSRRVFSPDEIASGNVRSLAVAPDGRLWIGSSGGIDVYQDNKRVAHFGGPEGLPCTQVLRLKFDSHGVLWAATARGLGRYDGTHWVWRDSRRWLPADSVWDVALAEDGTAYVATTGGLSILKQKKMSLAEKADVYEKLVRERHVRPPGLVEHCILKQPGDLSQHTPTDTDNDGLFTGLYVGAEAYRFAMTGDREAAQHARESYRAMEYLQTVTETPGFVARTVIPAEWDGMADRNRTYTPQEVAAERVANPRFRLVEDRWRKSRDGKWLWKGDTSSDEISGHYFAYGVYYDLVADEAERRRVAQLVGRITDHIIEGGYTLRDIDGQPTLWGVWAPERLLDDPDWQPERGSNSVEILSYLAVAHHVTGDEKYLRELEKLFGEKRYGELILEPKLSAPSEFTYIDDQLLAISYRGLLAYDRDPERRKVYLKSLRNWFDVIRRDHSPLYGFVYGGVMGGDFGALGCVEFLRDSPLDMVDWTIDNRHREDVRLVRVPVIEHVQVDRLLPASERSLNKWDKNPYKAVDGSGGRSESSSVHWLLPYWMGRYYGIIK